MRKLIDIDDSIVEQVKSKASNQEKDVKNYIQDLIFDSLSDNLTGVSRPLKKKSRLIDKNGKKRGLTSAEIQTMVDVYNAKIKRQKEGLDQDIEYNTTPKQTNSKAKELQAIADSVE